MNIILRFECNWGEPDKPHHPTQSVCFSVVNNIDNTKANQLSCFFLAVEAIVQQYMIWPDTGFIAFCDTGEQTVLGNLCANTYSYILLQ